eukprot:TRINITY_DN94856_c0_g1_i1.p1 TRINITY_DN94856_c0_g1~~TRINITY_DN94856_c0_g1_i1.p1  ORF type:complete len:706 (-),score=166.08 TRINITY_DN94856_c0_g1_i1:49-2166(-)
MMLVSILCLAGVAIRTSAFGEVRHSASALVQVGVQNGFVPRDSHADTDAPSGASPAMMEARRRRRSLQSPSSLVLAEEEETKEAMLQRRSESKLLHWLFVGGVLLLLVGITHWLTHRQEHAAEPKEESTAQIPERSEHASQPETSLADSAADMESLLTTMGQSIVQKVGPKLAKGQAVRSILESRLYEFPEKAKSLLLNELNSTAGAVRKAWEQEEAMMVLELDKAISTSFPPISVVVAGLVSPTMLSFSYSALTTQLFVVILPVFVMCAYALWEDHGKPCSIPTMSLWTEAQFGIALFLGVANGMVAWKIMRGKKALDAKTRRMQVRIEAVRQRSAQGMGASDFKELVVCNSVLIEEALLLEDEVKASPWFNAVGVGTVVWLLTMLWTFVVVIGWTFVPGQVAFDDSAKNSNTYCGAWASVLTARVSCVLAVLFIVVNFFTVINWLCTKLLYSEGFSASILETAKAIDKGGLGFPVAEVLVKALLLRSASETARSKLSVALVDQGSLEQERAELRKELAALDAKISERSQEVEAIEKKAADAAAGGVSQPYGFEANIAALESADITAMGSQWKELGRQAAKAAEAKASGEVKTSTDELEKLMQKFTDLASSLQESEAFQAMATRAQAAAEAGMEQATAAAEQLQDAAPGIVAKAKAAAEAGMAQATAAAEQLQDAAPGIAAKTQAAAKAGMAQATAAAEQLKEK